MKKFSLILASIGVLSFLIYATGILWLPIEAKALLYVNESERASYIKHYYDIHATWDKCSKGFKDKSAAEACYNKTMADL